MRKALLTKAPADVGAAPNDVIQNTVVVSRQPASQHLVLNSADRWVSATVGGAGRFQPWNEFKLQRPQALMEAFARRVRVCEVKFPWAIPNVNQYTNTLWLCKDNDYTIDKFVQVTIPTGFYTPSEMVTQFNTSAQAAYVAAGYIANDAPVLSYLAPGQQFKFTPGVSGATFSVFPLNPAGLTQPQYVAAISDNYRTQPSLLKNILGIFEFQLGLPPNASAITGGTTFMEYTSYIDIISDKLNYFSDMKDGSSGLTTATSIVCRLYLADEISITSDVPKACRPFMIHRQFKNDKAIQWSPEAQIDWLDIRVEDQYGNLVPLPTVVGVTGSIPYPDFQITMLASES